MSKSVRRAVLSAVLLVIAGSTLSACAVYADGPYRHHRHHDWNDRDRDRDHRRW